MLKSFSKARKAQGVREGDFVDAYCDLESRINLLKQEMKDLKAQQEDILSKHLEPCLESLGDDDETVLQGDSWSIVAGARSRRVSEVDAAKVRDILGDDVFMGMAQVRVTDLRKYLTGSEVSAVSSEVRGSRRLKAVYRG